MAQTRDLSQVPTSPDFVAEFKAIPEAELNALPEILAEAENTVEPKVVAQVEVVSQAELTREPEVSVDAEIFAEIKDSTEPSLLAQAPGTPEVEVAPESEVNSVAEVFTAAEVRTEPELVAEPDPASAAPPLPEDDVSVAAVEPEHEAELVSATGRILRHSPDAPGQTVASGALTPRDTEPAVENEPLASVESQPSGNEAVLQQAACEQLGVEFEPVPSAEQAGEVEPCGNPTVAPALVERPSREAGELGPQGAKPTLDEIWQSAQSQFDEEFEAAFGAIEQMEDPGPSSESGTDHMEPVQGGEVQVAQELLTAVDDGDSDELDEYSEQPIEASLQPVSQETVRAFKSAMKKFLVGFSTGTTPHEQVDPIEMPEPLLPEGMERELHGATHSPLHSTESQDRGNNQEGAIFSTATDHFESPAQSLPNPPLNDGDLEIPHKSSLSEASDSPREAKVAPAVTLVEPGPEKSEFEEAQEVTSLNELAAVIPRHAQGQTISASKEGIVSPMSEQPSGLAESQSVANRAEAPSVEGERDGEGTQSRGGDGLRIPNEQRDSALFNPNPHLEDPGPNGASSHEDTVNRQPPADRPPTAEPDGSGPTQEDVPTVEAPPDVTEAAVGESQNETLPTVAPAQPEPLAQIEFDIPGDYLPSAESTHEIFRVPMMGFDGPLDLLLFLIRRHEVDILDIPMALICQEYLAYMRALDDLDIDVAAEFLLMAAELLHIKSRCLLPQSEDLEDEEEGDPRAELVRRLLEYQKYKEAAEYLGARPRLNRDVFERLPEVVPYDSKDSPLKEMSVFTLVQTFDHIVRRKKLKRKHHVVLDNISIRQRIEELLELLAAHENLEFDSLLEDVNTKIELIVSFLAVLEMAKMKVMRVYQSENGDLYLQPQFSDPDEVMRSLSGLDESQYA